MKVQHWRQTDHLTTTYPDQRSCLSQLSNSPLFYLRQIEDYPYELLHLRHLRKLVSPQSQTGMLK
jgi:hypothetical protein